MIPTKGFDGLVAQPPTKLGWDFGQPFVLLHAIWLQSVTVMEFQKAYFFHEGCFVVFFQCHHATIPQGWDLRPLAVMLTAVVSFTQSSSESSRCSTTQRVSLGKVSDFEEAAMEDAWLDRLGILQGNTQLPWPSSWMIPFLVY